MPVVTINGTQIEVDKGTTLLRAAAEAGFDVPHFCYHPALSAPANCRMCLVEVEGAPKLLPGCYNAVSDGMVMLTESERVVRARKAVLEFILVNHPVDCPICDKAGECKLQDYYFAYDAQESRMRAEKQHKVKAYPIGPRIVYDGERCILCTRCIRFCEEITGTGELTLVDRGDKIEVRTFPGAELDNDYSLCTVDICPVGALTSRDFRFKCRVWLLTSTESICTGCATGCSIYLDHFRNEAQRYRPRYNREVNEYWMCDEGRLTYTRLHEERHLYPLSNGAEVTWHAIAQTCADKLNRVVERHGADHVAFVLSPQASCEDLYMAKRLWEEGFEGKAQLFLGGLPAGRSDDFLIHADKNPNRAGVQAVFGTMDDIRPFDQLAGAIRDGSVNAVYMMGSEVPVEHDAIDELVGEGGLFGSLELFVLQAMRQGRLVTGKPHVFLPSCSHAEKEGTFVNAQGVFQPFYKAFEPHGDSMPDWQILMRVGRAMGVGDKMRVTFLSQIQDTMFEATHALQAEAAKKAAETEHAAQSPEVAETSVRTNDGDHASRDVDKGQPPPSGRGVIACTLAWPVDTLRRRAPVISPRLAEAPTRATRL